MSKFTRSQWLKLGLPALLLFLAGLLAGRFLLPAPPMLQLFGEAQLRVPADAARLTGRIERTDYDAEDAVKALNEDRRIVEKELQAAGYPTDEISWSEVRTAPAGRETRYSRQFQLELLQPEKLIPLQLELLGRGIRLDCKLRYRLNNQELREQLTQQALDSAGPRVEMLAAALNRRPGRPRVLEVLPLETAASPDDPVVTLKQVIRIGVPLK